MAERRVHTGSFEVILTPFLSRMHSSATLDEPAQRLPFYQRRTALCSSHSIVNPRLNDELDDVNELTEILLRIYAQSEHFTSSLISKIVMKIILYLLCNIDLVIFKIHKKIFSIISGFFYIRVLFFHFQSFKKFALSLNLVISLT